MKLTNNENNNAFNKVWNLREVLLPITFNVAID